MKLQRLKYRYHAQGILTLGLALLAQLGAIQVQAVMFSFHGTITATYASYDRLPDGFSMGTTLSGTVFYDPSQSSLDGNSNPSLGSYIFNNPLGSDFILTVTGDGHTISSIATPSGPFNNVSVSNNTPQDVISYNIPMAQYDEGPLPNGLTNFQLTLEFTDISGTALSDDSLPAFPPSLSAFPDNPRFSFFAIDGLGDSVGFQALITSLNPVPEPGEWALITGGCLVSFAFVRRHIALRTPLP